MTREQAIKELDKIRLPRLAVMTSQDTRKSLTNDAGLTAEQLADSIPFELLMAAVRIHWGRRSKGKSGRKRTCGHKGDYIEGCPICENAKALKEKRDRGEQ